MSIFASPRLKSIAINVSGFGLGIFWIWRDECINPRIFKVPVAQEFPNSEIHTWNLAAGPKGSWSFPLDSMQTDAPIKKSSSVETTWYLCLLVL